MGERQKSAFFRFARFGHLPGVVAFDGDLQDVLYYEFVAEIDDTEFKSTAVVSPETTAWAIPADFIVLAEPDDEGAREIKFEIIVRVETGEHDYMDDGDIETVDSKPGNQSAVEDCFEIEI